MSVLRRPEQGVGRRLMRLLPMLRERFRSRTAAPAADIDPARFRQVMSRFATGVTVITAEANGAIRGMTANAFMSGSLHPPLCVVSIARRARMHDAIIAAGRFGVNMLAHGHENVSAHFAGRPVAELDVRFVHRAGTPLLDDACARIAAILVARHDCGDHSLFIGRIVHVEADKRAPLVVHASRYAALMYRDEDAAIPSVEFW